MTDEVSFLETILRFASAISLTIATIFIGANIFRNTLHPKSVWVYMGAITTILAAWRWVVVLLLYPSIIEDFLNNLAPWVQPINQALAFLTGLSILFLAIANTRRHVIKSGK